ncbi:uncharacterized protein BJ212DRAFT_637770 [Suillus subaureus]|uniref:Secreted protein n=1 Tax=Suillus subaureus TaxID=48587 RepID=A0A9P7J8S4_9AGAM|nr:uncharacterized protein BJ212DRAFT_637770 [Suillus subaureus]KAG1808591.1 hypothetical protein BJ212DRAFT_637770 [Suillus subaureus]
MWSRPPCILVFSNFISLITLTCTFGHADVCTFTHVNPRTFTRVDACTMITHVDARNIVHADTFKLYLVFPIPLSSLRSVALRLLQFGMRFCVTLTPTTMGIAAHLGSLLHRLGPLTGLLFVSIKQTFPFVLATNTKTAARQQTQCSVQGSREALFTCPLE